MVLPLLALGLMAGGTGMSLYGAKQKKQAMRDALSRYQGGLGQIQSEDEARSLETQRGLGALTDERFQDMGGALNQFMAAPTTRAPEDTALIDQSLAKVRSTGVPQSGAAANWGTGVQDKNLSAINGLVDTAGDAGMLRRQARGQQTALGNFGINDTRRGRQGQQLGQMDALRRQLLQRRLAALQGTSQIDFNNAGRAGDDQMMIGGLMGMGGSFLGSLSSPATPKPAPTAPGGGGGGVATPSLGQPGAPSAANPYPFLGAGPTGGSPQRLYSWE